MPFNPDTDLAAQWEDLIVFQNKDADLVISILAPGSTVPYNLTGLTVTFTRKPNRDVPDSMGKIYACTVTSPLTGIATVTLPAVDNSLTGVTWYRVDLVGTETKSVKFGRMTVFAV